MAEYVAYHEAAHCLAYHALGGEIDSVTIAGQPHVECVSDPPDLLDRLVMLLAGPAGTDAYFKMQRTLFQDELADYAARVDDVVFGNCDHCRAVLVATVHASKTGGDRAAIFRDGERRASAFVRVPAVWAAIRALSAALMERHTIAGPDAHAIIGRYLEFGSMKHET